jgi:hypothetical protein
MKLNFQSIILELMLNDEIYKNFNYKKKTQKMSQVNMG